MIDTIQRIENAFKTVIEADAITGLTVVEANEGTLETEVTCLITAIDQGPVEEDLAVFRFSVELELRTPIEATETVTDPEATRHDVFEKLRRVVYGENFITSLAAAETGFAFYDSERHSGRHETDGVQGASFITFDLIVGCGE